MTKITKRVVDAAQSSTKPFFIWDVEIKGFGLIVLPSGVKSYLYQYRTPEGRSRRATIGKHGDWTAEQAREKADGWREMVRAGKDPLAERKKRREALSVADLLDEYLESPKFAEKASSTQAIDRGRVSRHLKPTLGKLIADQVKPDDVRRAFKAITEGKTAADVKTGRRGRAIVTGGEGAARGAIKLLRAVYSWAIEEGAAPDNPAAPVNIGTDGQKDVILGDAKAYERLFKALDALEAEKAIRSAVADAIRVLALTGARRNEIAGLRWRHVDLKANALVLPPAEHKTGRRVGKPRVIGLPAAAQLIIARQPEGQPDDFVFTPAKGEGAVSLSKPWRVVRVRAKLPEGIGLHGLRHSLASHLAMDGAQGAELMQALGHKQISTTQRYIHFAEKAKARLAERAASTALAGMRASKKKAGTKMHTLRNRTKRLP
jgi:integrase